MEEKKKISEIERIKLQLEQKLLEIERRKEANNSKKLVNPTKKEEKTLFELRKELQKLQKNKVEEVKDVKIEHKSPITSSINSEKPIQKKSKEIISEIKKVEKPLKKENLKGVKTTIKVTKSANPKTIPKTEKKKSTSIEKEKLTNKSASSLKESTTKISTLQKSKDGTIARNKIIFIIAFTFALLYLGYLYRLKVDLHKEKEALEKKKQEQIDYSKKDVIFKEVEEDPAPEELQDIK
jgi:hypothetical protein